VVIRNLHARFALNDGFNLHGAALDYRLQNVTAYGCFDNGISPHGACSFTAEDSRFWGNEMALGNDFATQTRFIRCEFAGSTQEEIMCIGGKHVFEDCRIRATGSVAIRLIHTRRTPQFVLNEIKLAGADPNIKSEVMFRNCTMESADDSVRQIVTQPGPSVTFDRCVFKRIEFKPEKASNIRLVDCTLDGELVSQP
jgi:hypothetical protein